MSSAETKTVSYSKLVKTNANFRYLWFGQIVSLLGDWFNLIASATLIATLSQSGIAVSGLFVVRMLAPFITSAFAGVVADRYNKKNILILTDLLRAATLLCFLFVRDAGDIWLLYTLTGIQFAISGFFTPTKTAILPELVSDKELGAANTLSAATWSVMLSLGAALGGLVSGFWGIYPAFIIDAFTFLLSAFFIMKIKLSNQQLPDQLTSLASLLKEYLYGFRFLAKHHNILVTAFHKAMIASLAGSTFEIIQVAISEEVFTMGEGGGISLGLMFMMTGLGSGIGPFIARRITGDKTRALQIAIIIGYSLASLGYMVVTPLTNFPLTLFGILLRGLGGGIIWVFSTQLLLQQVPEDVRGRVFAAEFAFFMLAASIAAVLVGQALDVYSLSQIIRTLSFLVLIPAALWALWTRYQRRLA